MSADAARCLLDVRPVDWYEPGARFGEYLCGGATFDEARGVLRFDLGWVTWRLPKMMHLIAALKDIEGTDTLVHHSPTYDAWYETGAFFIEPGRWAYVGAGPMFDVERGDYEQPAHVGPAVPTVNDARGWNEAGPLARAVRPSADGVWLDVDTVRGPSFRCGVWHLPDEMRWTDDVIATLTIVDGGASVTFTSEGKRHVITVRDLYEAREPESTT